MQVLLQSPYFISLIAVHNLESRLCCICCLPKNREFQEHVPQNLVTSCSQNLERKGCHRMATREDATHLSTIPAMK